MQKILNARCDFQLKILNTPMQVHGKSLKKNIVPNRYIENKAINARLNFKAKILVDSIISKSAKTSSSIGKTHETMVEYFAKA